MAEIPPGKLEYQLAHKDDFNGEGLNALIIIGLIVTTLLVIARLYSRKYVQGIGWHADDYTLIVGQIITFGSALTFSIQVEYFGYGRHYLTLTKAQQVNFTKVHYAYNIIYTVAYPLCKISLTLLYRRIFILRWFNWCCWTLIMLFAGYATSTALANIWLTIPINAYWDLTVHRKHQINETALYKTNAWFNIITDVMLFVLPLSVVWRLRMGLWRKFGLSLVFLVGVLTIVASIMRLVLFYNVDDFDPSYTLCGLGKWTGAEQFLGVICPCLPTLRPLIQLYWEKSTSRFSHHSSSQSQQSSSNGRRPMTRTTLGERKVSESKLKGWGDLMGRKRSDKELLRRSEPGQKDMDAIKTLDPRYAGAKSTGETKEVMGNLTDAHHSESEESGRIRDEEQGLRVPGNSIAVEKGFAVEDRM